ncbi:hypothetical protein APR41_05345 [Salegentibacter salinarum]|uniref:Uncharacterized protein n=1 Tax=Salegentibacter salinarum TaxID=447422 RepID=A0A2N0TSD6_9FLAO|nr:hypothetical protein [Salegentibacter salinarum]PKD17635.1 hypothetical protein APR41_05345 [Salegentibacter salinarum]SKB50045.1 hypothetical protein SAMN05660903_01095 [Salegentibacter salinarum]
MEEQKGIGKKGSVAVANSYFKNRWHLSEKLHPLFHLLLDRKAPFPYTVTIQKWIGINGRFPNESPEHLIHKKEWSLLLILF